MNIVLTQDVYNKVMHWVNKADFEVSGFGKVVRSEDEQGNHTFTVVSAHLLKQKGSAAHTDIDQAALAKLMYTSKDEEGELKWWWHSHVNMSVFWSGTDTKTIEELGINGWIVATVFNKKYESKSALCYRTESMFGYNKDLFDDIPMHIDRPTNPDISAWDEEFTDNVVREGYGYTPPTPTTGRHLAWKDDDWEYDVSSGVYNPKQRSLLDPPDTVGLISDSAIEEARVLSIPYARYKTLIDMDDDATIDGLITKLLEDTSTLGMRM